MCACKHGEPPSPPAQDAASDAIGEASVDASADGDAEADVIDPDAPYLSGHTWVSCYQGFAPDQVPLRDLTRLSMLCGPYHGMRPIEPVTQGKIRPGDKKRAAFTALENQCLRLFAVGAPTISALHARVLGPHGETVAEARADSRVLVMQPEGAFCVTESGRYVAELETTQGEGEFAMQVWLLR